MSPFRLIAFKGLIIAALVGSAAAQPATQPDAMPDSQARQLLDQASRLVNKVQVKQAIQLIDRVITESDTAICKSAAAVMRGQLTGTFNQRHAAWLEREVVDIVVVVPDPTSYLEALAYWDDKRFFPVLLDDGWLSGVFVRAFKPGKVLTYQTRKPLEGEALTQAVKQAIAKHNQRIAQAKRLAPGIVVIDPAHRHAVMGLALAIGRGQPVLEYKPPKIEGAPPINPLVPINKVIMEAAVKANLVDSTSWFGITLVGDYPLKYKLNNRLMATDDLLGRGGNMIRFGVAGRLFGWPSQASFQAMGSLFLQPKDVLLVDDYANRGGGFSSYQLDQAAELFGKRFTVHHLTGKEANPAMLRKVGREQMPDMIFINSSGGRSAFDLRGRATTKDLSMGHATIYHFIHSFSAQQIAKSNTLAGRALLNGAYWFFGSMDEPGLGGFKRPTGVAVRYLTGTPLAFAVRHDPLSSRNQPWKLTIVGDPLLSHRAVIAQRALQSTGTPFRKIRPKASDPASQFAVALYDKDMDKATAAALAALPRSEKLKPGQVVTAMWLALRAGRSDVLLQTPQAAARKHELAAMMFRDTAISRFNAAIAAEKLDQALPALKPMLVMDRSGTAKGMLRRYLAIAAKQGKAKATEAQLRQWAAKAPAHTRKLIESTFKPSP
jgi:nitroreductase